MNILPSRCLLENTKCVEVGGIVVVAAKLVDAIDVIGLPMHEVKMMSAGIEDRMVLCRTQPVGV